jgi:hypothetical protein
LTAIADPERLEALILRGARKRFLTPFFFNTQSRAQQRDYTRAVLTIPIYL